MKEKDRLLDVAVRQRLLRTRIRVLSDVKRGMRPDKELLRVAKRTYCYQSSPYVSVPFCLSSSTFAR